MLGVNASEADIIVRGLRPFPLSEVGTSAWKEQRDNIEQLNIASHTNAAQNRDDFVMTFLIEHEKLPVIVHELLAMEQMRLRLYPHLAEALIHSPTGTYMYCYYEGVLVNLLECIFYHEEALQSLGDDVLEVVDYFCRSVVALLSLGDDARKIPEADPKLEMSRSDTDRFWNQQHTLSVNRAMASLSCIWFVVDKMKNLPMALANNVLMKNDVVMLMAQVADQQPWTRRGPGKIEKFKQGEYKQVTAEDAMVITSPEAHVWFTLHVLLCDREWRMKYQYTSHKKEYILRCRRFLNETLVDQIPALIDLQRALEELSFMEPPTGTEEKFKNTLVIEPVPRIQSEVTRLLPRGDSEAAMRSVVQPIKERIAEKSVEDAQRYSKLFDLLIQNAGGDISMDDLKQ